MILPPPQRIFCLARTLAKRESVNGVDLPFHRAIANFRLGLETLVGPHGADAMVYRAIFLTRRRLGLVVTSVAGQTRERESLIQLEGSKGSIFTENVLAHLIALLIDFIGEDLTLSYLREAWPGLEIPEDDDAETSNA
jgi:hypothetical protein